MSEGTEVQVRKSSTFPNAVACTATSKGTGKPCANPAMAGSTVCRHHGGSAQQVRRKAQLRLQSLVEPAIAVLLQELTNANSKPADRLRAVENVLDRTGFGRSVERDESTARQLLLDRLLEARAEAEEDEQVLDVEVVEEDDDG